MIYAEPCYPSIRPSTNSHISPCNSKPLIVYKPYLRHPSWQAEGLQKDRDFPLESRQISQNKNVNNKKK